MNLAKINLNKFFKDSSILNNKLDKKLDIFEIKQGLYFCEQRKL